MLRVVVALAIFALYFGVSYSTPIQDKSAKSNDDSESKDMMRSGGEDRNMENDGPPTVDLMAIMNQCNDSFSIEMAIIESLDENGSFPDETDRTPKCYVRCVLETSGVASKEGIFDPARAAVVFAGERGGKNMTDIEDLAAACTDRKETCKCERAYRFMKCLMESEIKEYESN